MRRVLLAAAAISLGLLASAHAEDLVRIRPADHMVNGEVSAPQIYGAVIKAADEICASDETRPRRLSLARRFHHFCMMRTIDEAIAEADLPVLATYHADLPAKARREVVSGTIKARFAAK